MINELLSLPLAATLASLSTGACTPDAPAASHQHQQKKHNSSTCHLRLRSSAGVASSDELPRASAAAKLVRVASCSRCLYGYVQEFFAR